MSLYEPPHLDPRVYVKCTCGTAELRHRDGCAVLDETSPAWDRARDITDKNSRYWFGPKSK